jgi:hypothetical protein
MGCLAWLGIVQDSTILKKLLILENSWISVVALSSFLMQLSIVSVLVVLRHGVNPKRLSAAICVAFAQINSILLLRIA